MENSELIICLSLLKTIGLSKDPHICDMGYVVIATVEDDNSIYI